MFSKVFNKIKFIKKSSRFQALNNSLLFILAIIISTGCVPSLFSSKGAEQPKDMKKSESTLIKPRLAQQPNSDEKVGTEINQTTKNNQSNTDNTRYDEKLVPASSDRTSQKDHPTSDKQKDLLDKEKVSKRLVGAEKGKVPAESEQIKGDKPSEAKIKSSEDEDWITSDSRTPTFKKHDHSKYVAHIKNKAIDILNRDRDSFYATLCSDSTTEQRTLTMYYKDEKSFRYKSFVWDEIDDKWEQQFESAKRQLASWKKHLSFVSSGKQCSVLKGGKL
jgi:hypothetical protein